MLGDQLVHYGRKPTKFQDGSENRYYEAVHLPSESQLATAAHSGSRMAGQAIWDQYKNLAGWSSNTLPDSPFKEFGIALMLTCRKLYLTIFEIFWTTNTFSFSEASELTCFARSRTPAQIQRIQHMHICTYPLEEPIQSWRNQLYSFGISTQCSGLSYQLPEARPIERFQSLKTLHITLYHPFLFSPNMWVTWTHFWLLPVLELAKDFPPCLCVTVGRANRLKSSDILRKDPDFPPFQSLDANGQPRECSLLEDAQFQLNHKNAWN